MDLVRKVLVDQLGVDDEAITLSAKLGDDLGADSLDRIELMMAFEEELKIEIPDGDAELIETVAELVGYLDRRTLTASTTGE
jgi:acyl carrier protein